MNNKDAEEKINKIIDEILAKLKEIEDWSIIDEGLLTHERMPEVRQLIEELRRSTLSDTSNNEKIIRAGNTYLKITKEGKIQVSTREGTAHLRPKDGSSFTTTSSSWVDVTGSSDAEDIEIVPQSSEETKTILKAIGDVAVKLEHQQEQFNKIFSLVSKMYNDGEINKDTFNKLDEFLKPYYDNPYNDGNY